MIILKRRKRYNNVFFSALLFFMFSIMHGAYSQQSSTDISGKVVDEQGVALPGVTVIDMNSGGKTATVTDVHGAFKLKVKGATMINFSCLGFVSKDISSTQLKDAKVTLAEESQTMNEVVVIGYGAVKKKDLTGSVSSIKNSELTSSSPTNIAQGLQGKLAGVQVIQSDGAPGASMNILVRGANSFSTNSEPLYVVDGIPYDGSLSTISPNDIESIDILKDASATAIYGSRGANGVVLITTKRSKGSDRIEFSASTSVNVLNPSFDVLDGVDYAHKRNESFTNQMKYYGGSDGGLPFPSKGVWEYADPVNRIDGTYRPSPDDFRNPRVVTDGFGNSSSINNTDWMDMITQTGVTQQYDLSISGGSEKGNHALSIGYLDQKGTLIGTGYERYTGRMSIDRKPYSWLDVGVTLNLSRELTDIARDQIDGGAQGNLLRSALIYPTNLSEKDVDENETMSYLTYNPATFMNNQTNKSKKLWISTSSFVQIKLYKDLVFRQNIGYYYSQDNGDVYYNRYTYAGSAANKVNGRARRSAYYGEGPTFESLLTYSKTFNDIHKFNAVLGMTYERRLSGHTSNEAQNFSDDLTGYYDMSKATILNYMQSGQSKHTLLSFLGRVNYTLKDKYLFTATFRRDGSSKFKKGNQYANFMSGAFAWRASEEQFIKNLNFFNDLKFRLSYGETGNQGVGPYETLPRMMSGNTWIDGKEVNGYSVSGPVDGSLKWETTSQINGGIDLSILKGRVGFVVDYYYKETRDLLQYLAIPPSTGYSSIRTNYGNITNEGLEITGNFFPVATKDWNWRMNANIAFNRNKIGGLKGDQYAGRVWTFLENAIIQRNGYPIGTLYGYVSDGFYNNLAEVRADPEHASKSDISARQLIGEVKYRDLDNDNRITDADRTAIGDVNPKFVYGITNTVSWKNLSVNIFLQGTYGNDILNGNTTDIRLDNGGNIPAFMYRDRWTPEKGNSAKWPKLQDQGRNLVFSDKYVEDGSYLRIKNISIAYDFVNPFKSKAIKNINVAISGQNLYTWTNYSWFDPDVSVFGNDISRRGVDMYAYPSSRIFTLTLKATF